MTSLTVNRQPVRFDLDPDTPLLYALREAMNLTGTKSCGGGECGGACMVLIDGVALRSCKISLAEAEGRFVVTIEGLSPNRSHPVQLALVEAQAIQCGYCTPGMVIAGAALLERNPAPSREEIEAAIPNLCRCGVYPRLVRAMMRAGRAVQRRETISAVSEASDDVPALQPGGSSAEGP